ncbi:WXG100 family type VII secretion target [Streptomyces sp. NPDC058739]|uniref:WXG100 family type VII secretion target n=1 Tax=Streptomyces sp. NPDC058739 TaxID=3346618 RepID=UPI0036A3B556
MSEMDMEIQHGALKDANAHMKQIAGKMDTALEAIMQRLLAIKSGFTGEAAKEFTEFQRVVNNLDANLSHQFDKGADLLADAHNIIQNGDRRSAYHFQR